MANPKHKIFFGAPGNITGNLTGKSSGGGGIVTITEPDFTWDNDILDFSTSKKVMYNSDYDPDTLAGL